MPPKQKLKQHKSIENRKKLTKKIDFNSLERVKARLTKQQHDRKKEMKEVDTSSRYAEIEQGVNAPEMPVLEQSAAHEAFRNLYFSQFKKVVDNSDVLLEVLDSRDPMGCRSTSLENYILKRGKRVVLVLNKCDLIPDPQILEGWAAFLRREFPVILFKASSDPARANYVPLGRTAHSWRATDVFGVTELLQLLNRYASGGQITVGVIGPPNAGKSSIINSLARRKCAGVASTPGFTKTMQEVEVTSHIRVLDCPGVVPSSGEMITPSMILRNAIKIELLDDPITPVAALLNHVPKAQLVDLYHIESYGDADDFLSQVAKSRGRLKKGGEPDIEQAAREVLMDWNHGRIKYFTTPPKMDAFEVSTELVDQDGRAYNMQRTTEYTKEELEKFQVEQMFLVQGGPVKKPEQEDDETFEEEEAGEIRPEKNSSMNAVQASEMNSLADQFQQISFDNL